MSTLPGVDAAPRDASKSQWYTPPELAERIAGWALEPCLDRVAVLEPSAGEGALVAALYAHPKCTRVDAVDIDPRNVVHLRRAFAGCPAVGVVCADFLDYCPPSPFRLAVMNPPFEGGQTEQHILHALDWADRVVCHCPLTTLEGKARKASLWSRVSLTRMVIHSTRPKYGGGKAGATAMCTVEVVPELQDACKTAIEWW